MGAASWPARRRSRSRRSRQVSAKGDIDEGIEAEKGGFAAAFVSEDAKEGIAAFLGKRTPKWSGRVARQRRRRSADAARASSLGEPRRSRTVALTGAGVSVPSGIPDFRTPGTGLWANVDPIEVAYIDAFERDPEALLVLLPAALPHRSATSGRTPPTRRLPSSSAGACWRA